jgi:hypothetical protein
MMRIFLFIIICGLCLTACGKRGNIEAEDQIYPRAYPNPALGKKTPCA